MNTVEVYVNGNLVLSGTIIETEHNDDEVEMIVEDDKMGQYIVQIPNN
jgi:hypothetical protein